MVVFNHVATSQELIHALYTKEKKRLEHEGTLLYAVGLFLENKKLRSVSSPKRIHHHTEEYIFVPENGGIRIKVVGIEKSCLLIPIIEDVKKEPIRWIIEW
jgi:hypothetical protein